MNDVKTAGATKRQQFSLAFLFLQIFWIGVALRSIRVLLAVILRPQARHTPTGFVCFAPSVVFGTALGAFIGGFWRRTVAGAVLGGISVPALIALLFFLALVCDATGLVGNPP